MSLHVTHTLLITSRDFTMATQRALHFFENSTLIHYDDIQIMEDISCSALTKHFQPRLKKALRKNQAKLKKLLTELQNEGYSNLNDLMQLPLGFHSKILHTLAHMVDGFFGIDAAFFDLDESSYTLSAQRKQQLLQQPDKCWLLTIEATSTDSLGSERSAP